jgi:hypothetical protein
MFHLCLMLTVVLIVFALLLLLIFMLLFAPVVIEADTRVPYAELRWAGIGSGMLFYEGEEWKLRVTIFFYTKTLVLPFTSGAREKVKKEQKKKRKKQIKFSKLWPKILRMLKTFKVHYWQLAVDTGDYVRNAQLYPVNVMPGLNRHVRVNFTGENYCCFSISNRPWKLLYAWIR